MSDPMSSTKRNVIRYNYVIAEWISTFCAIAGTLFDLYDDQHPHSPKPKNTGDYIVNFGVAIVAATVAAYTANKFQGVKIGRPPEARESGFRYPQDLTPRNWKSNVGESSYLIFSLLLLAFNNYFLFAAINASLEAFSGDEKAPALSPLSAAGWIVLIIKTFPIDLIFNITNANFEAAEEIKEDITGSKAGPLINKILTPFAKGSHYTFTIRWIKTIGVLSHTLTDYFSLLLCIPRNWLISLYQKPAAFWPVATLGLILSIPLIFVNFIQTLFFEGKESEINLRRLQKESIVEECYPPTPPPVIKSKLLYSLLQWMPALKKPIRYGFFTQGPLNAMGDAMPVYLFTQDMFDRFESGSNAKMVVAVLLALYVFVGSWWGTRESEVATATHYYDEDFKDIDDSTVWANLCA